MRAGRLPGPGCFIVRVLYLTRWFPHPSNNGSKIRIYNLMRRIAAHHQVTLLSFADTPHVNVDAPALRAICQEIYVVPWKPFQPDGLKAKAAFFNPSPRSVVDTFSPEMAARIETLLSSGAYDLVVASEFDCANYSARFNGTPAIFEDPELGAIYEEYALARSVKKRVRHYLTWLKQRRHLRRLLQNFRACTVVSERERELVSMIAPHYKPIEVVPNCITVSDYVDVQERPEPDTLIFTGSFSYYPNYEAMVWFLRDVFSQVLAEIPDTHLRITGDHQNRPLPNKQNVTLTGFVEDIRPLIAASWISIAPIWQGGGTRLKILEAMALRTPVIATSKGAEGLDVQQGEHLLIADTPADFAAATLRLLRDAPLRQRLVENGYRLVCEKYDWDQVAPHFLQLMEWVAQR